MNYLPAPIDVSAVRLPPEVTEITEILAENTHALWAKRKLDDGWTFGPTVDAGKRTHPFLVPYSELPESIREYDRTTSMGTLRTLLALGYFISKRPAGCRNRNRRRGTGGQRRMRSARPANGGGVP